MKKIQICYIIENVNHQLANGGIFMLEKIIAIITAQLGCDAELINEDSTLFEDLGADSLDLVEILMAVEENFGVSIPDEEMPEFRTVSDILAYIDNSPEGTNE